LDELLAHGQTTTPHRSARAHSNALCSFLTTGSKKSSFSVSPIFGIANASGSQRAARMNKGIRILVVDDNDDIRSIFKEGLENRGYEVVAATTVNEALYLISTQKFDALLSDLHMPDAGDGLTVVSAMRHAHPEAVTVVQSGYPALEEAMTAILLQADEILMKPVSLAQIADIIGKRLSTRPNALKTTRQDKEKVATILERDADKIIQEWHKLVEKNQELAAIPLESQERTGHVALLLSDIVSRLRLPLTANAIVSRSAREHGVLRRKQGYNIPLIVEESRMLQVSIFNVLQSNLGTVDFSTVLLDVMTIADEVDSQLKQAVIGFSESWSTKSASVSGNAN
jgi:CheY-like chemotaxis protein